MTKWTWAVVVTISTLFGRIEAQGDFGLDRSFEAAVQAAAHDWHVGLLPHEQQSRHVQLWRRGNDTRRRDTGVTSREALRVAASNRSAI